MERLGYAMVGLAICVASGCESAPEEQSEHETPTSADTADSGPFTYSHSIGEPGSGPGEFDQPIGLAVEENGKLYVSEGGNDRLQRFGADGESAAVWAEGIGRPMHIALDGGRLLVPVYQQDRIQIFDGPGEEVDRFGGDWVDAPSAVDVGPDGKVYVADFYNHRFHVVSPEGELGETIGEKGKAPGKFTYPTDIEVTPSGDIWVADAYAHRIQMFGPDGTHERTVGTKGTGGAGQFHVATGLDRGPEGLLYVADFKNDRVQVLEVDGTPVAVLEGSAEGDRGMSRPTEVVATSKKLYVVDHGNDQIDVYDRNRVGEAVDGN